jgi:hypothetical protein
MLNTLLELKAINPKYQNLINRLLAARAAYDVAIDDAHHNDEPEDTPKINKLFDRIETIELSLPKRELANIGS